MDGHAWLVWLLIGIGLYLAELALPGFILLFFGIGAWVAAAACLGFSPGVPAQIGIFLVASLISLALLRRLFTQVFSGRAKAGPEPGEMSQAVGLSAQVTADIAPGAPGEIQFRGSYWRAVADAPIAKGQAAVIQAVSPDDPLTYKVKPLVP